MASVSDSIKITSELVKIPSESSDPVRTDPLSVEQKIVEYLQALCSRVGIKHETTEVQILAIGTIFGWPCAGPAA